MDKEQTAGDAVIAAVIRAQALDTAEIQPDGSVIFVWSANSPEQIEAALAEAGWTLTKVPEPS